LPGSGGLVLGEGDETEIILRCYSLARAYHQAPEYFLNMPVTEVSLHWLRTQQLIEHENQDRDAD
jgi:hypothetical protein